MSPSRPPPLHSGALASISLAALLVGCADASSREIDSPQAADALRAQAPPDLASATGSASTRATESCDVCQISCSVCVAAPESSTCKACLDRCANATCERSCRACAASPGSTECKTCIRDCKLDNDCIPPYYDTTPICNYLDRGLRDHRSFTSDTYNVYAPGVRTLADIDKLEFGLDLPATRCKDNPHGVPCADASYTREWWIDEVRLSAHGIPLFEAKKATSQPTLLRATGGAGDTGIVGFGGDELRKNPLWGLSFNELSALFKHVVIDENKRLAFNPEVLEFSARDLSHLIEGMFGRVLAAQAKGCANGLYCDNDRGLQGFWADTHGNGGQVDCDFGGCAPLSERSPSPWLEIKGSSDRKRLLIDADLQVANGTFDPGDCDGVGLGNGPDHCGTLYTSLGDFSLQIELAFACEEVGKKNGKEKYAIVVSPTSVDVGIEGGLLNVVDWVYAFGCSFVGKDCSVEELFKSRLAHDINKAISGQQLTQDLDACPAGDALVDVAPDGAVAINLAGTAACDEGAECLGHRVIAPGGFDLGAAPFRSAPAALLARLSFGQPLSAPSIDVIDAVKTAAGLQLSEIDWSAPLDLSQALGALDPDQKIPMAQLDEVMPMLCAMMSQCDADLDFAALTVPPPIVDDPSILLACDEGVDPSSEACQVKAALLAFITQEEIFSKCVVPRTPNVDDDLRVVLWLQDVATDLPACEEKLKPIETYIALPYIGLELTNGRLSTTDGFAFVDLQHAENVAAGVRDEYACRHRPQEALIPNPYEYGGCPDPENPAYFGTVGCPCADVDVVQAEDAAFDGGYADGAGSHVKNGLYGLGQYCDDGTAATPGNQVVCGKVTRQGKDYPVCQECGEDTNLGCPCQLDSDCVGLGESLSCWGSEQSGWGPSVGGKCLPDPGNSAGREAVSEMPWFCVDNCDAIDTYANGLTACVYNQLGGFSFSHGTCVNFLGSCEVEGVNLPGVCEEAGGYCDAEDQCVSECIEDADCSGKGFPDWYKCDFSAGYEKGHCVPPGCASANATLDASYCYLFR
ncbi:hypothetical protein WMF28_26365 [Sorangium sp. So ce590]|uniref:hypothetical protein n=1 Tax=Sorangium sp. So ce590 TaxID=3133317 RepID=UPI003F63F4E6